MNVNVFTDKLNDVVYLNFTYIIDKLIQLQ